MSDAVDGRSAARGRNTIVWQNDTFLQISPTLGYGTSSGRVLRRRGQRHTSHMTHRSSIRLGEGRVASWAAVAAGVPRSVKLS
eukprot:1732053-Prymnesium_polylepis.1